MHATKTSCRTRRSAFPTATAGARTLSWDGLGTSLHSTTKIKGLLCGYVGFACMCSPRPLAHMDASTNVRVNVLTNVYIYIHTYIHTFIHTCVCVSQVPGLCARDGHGTGIHATHCNSLQYTATPAHHTANHCSHGMVRV